MAVELVRGQNHPLERTRVDIRVAVAHPVVAGALLDADDGGRRVARTVLHAGEPACDGVEVPRQAAAEHRLAVDLEALPREIAHVTVFVALPDLPDAPSRFGGLAAPVIAVTAEDGTELASYAATGLDAENALVPVELYRRGEGWKVRAVGQGYAGGLPDLLRDHQLGEPDDLSGRIHGAVRDGAAKQFAAPPRPSAEGGRHRRSTTAGSAGQTAGGGFDAAQATGASGAVSGTGGSGVDYTHPGRARHRAGDPAEAAAPSGAAAGESPASGTGGSGVDYTHPGRRTAAAGSTPAGGSAGGASAGPGAGSAVPPPRGSVPPPPVPEPAPGGGPVAGDANGWTFEERLYNQVWGVFEDAARSAAAYRSAVDFADSRLDRELDEALSDPATRTGPAADAAQRAARERRAELVGRARETWQQDTRQLLAETRVVEEALPPAMARWEHPGWSGWQPVGEEDTHAVRIGDIHLADEPGLRIPMVVRLPQERGLWVDGGRPDPESATAEVFDASTAKRAGLRVAAAFAVRLLAAYRPGAMALHAVDPGRAGAAELAPLQANGLLAGPPATDAGEIQRLLGSLVERVDLVQMAIRNNATDSLPPHLDLGHQLLIVHEFPFGFDDRTVGQLRYLAEEGPSVGVQVLIVADRDDARAYGPVLEPLWRDLLRITPVASEHLADPWVGHAWTYEPLLPSDPAVFEAVCGSLGAALRKY